MPFKATERSYAKMTVLFFKEFIYLSNGMLHSYVLLFES